jgi:hypothetical protein
MTVGDLAVEIAHVQVGEDMAGEGSGAGLACRDEQPVRNNKKSRYDDFKSMIGQFF